MGMFEIAEPVLEGDEVFDSNLLKQTIESMIAAGRRNLCVDLSQLDYLYSDTINALVVMNKRMLDVFGRLSLLAPQPSVMEILKKGGIQNILKIFADENEIVQLSQQMSGQAMPAPAAAFPPPQPQSEFDSLRSEIGSAFESGPRTAEMPVAAPQPYAPPQAFGVQEAGQFQQAPPPAAPPAGPGMPQRPPFAPSGARPSFGPPPPPPSGAFPRYTPPRGFEPFPQKPPARGYTPPPPKPAAAPLAQGGETRRMPPVPEAPVSLRPRIQPREEPAVAQSEEDLEKIEASLEQKMPALEKHKPDFDEMEEAPKKKKGALVPMLVTLVVLVVAAGGSFYVYRTYIQKQSSAPAPAQKEAQQPAAPPELPVPEAPKTAAAPAVEEAAPGAVEPKPEPKKAEPLAPIKVVKKSAPAPAVTKRPAPKPVVRQQPQRRVIEEPEFEKEPAPVVTKTAAPPPEETPRPVVTAPAPVPTPAPAPEPAAGGEESTIFIGTLPPLADVYMDGKFIGKSSTELKVSPGTHTLRFVKGDKEFTKQFTFKPGKNPGTFVKMP
ncbi:MAG: PEGA domain-containing protein [Chitinispirillaceae bacterium]|nr:PEGA domain-containing protein [Chitinispirillaceae bacterium]